MSKPTSAGRHVLLLASHAPSLANFRGPLITELVRKGWRVTAVAPNFDDQSRERVVALGARPLEVNLSRTGMNPLGDLAYRRALIALLRSERPEVLLCYTIKPVIWGLLAARAAAVPRAVALITGLGYAFATGEKPDLKQMAAGLIARLLYWLALPAADVVLFQNPDDRDLFRKLGLTRNAQRVGITAGSGVDLTHYAATAVPPRLSFLMLARLLVAKGVGEYAQAARSLKQRYPQVEFRLAGDLDHGPGSITAVDLGRLVEGGVTYLGTVSDVRPALAEAGVYVLPSYYREGTPRSILEALATGRAIITTDAPGCRETVVEGENGFMVPPRDPKALERAMERFILEPELAQTMGERSLTMAREKYEVRLVNAQIIEALVSD